MVRQAVSSMYLSFCPKWLLQCSRSRTRAFWASCSYSLKLQRFYRPADLSLTFVIAIILCPLLPQSSCLFLWLSFHSVQPFSSLSLTPLLLVGSGCGVTIWQVFESHDNQNRGSFLHLKLLSVFSLFSHHLCFAIYSARLRWISNFSVQTCT